MEFAALQYLLLAFSIGFLSGSLMSYFFLRRTINKNIKSISQRIHALYSEKERKAKESESRRENLLLLADKLRQIENNIQKIREKEYNSFINNLNQLLNQTGIAKINDKN